MSDFLSQDDIDALLGLTSEPSAAADKGETATTVLNMFIEHVKSVSNATLMREVQVEIDYVDNATTTKIADNLGAEYLLADVPYSGGVNGNMRCLVSKLSAGKMSDLMVGGDGSAAYTDDCKDAMNEFYAQISGAFATELGAKVGASVSAQTPAIMDSAGGEVLEGDYAAFGKISIDGLDPITILMSPDEAFLESYAAKTAPPPAAATSQSSGGGGADIGGGGASHLHSFGGGPAAAGGGHMNIFSSKAPKINVDMLLDVELEVTIELGKTNIAIKKVLDLAPGALVELDRFAGEPVDLLVNNKVVAKGEVVVIDENFGVRIISLVSPEERIRSLK